MRAAFLTRRELRRVNDLVERAYGARFEEDGHHYFTRKRDLYRVSKDLERVDIDRIDEVFAGLYLGEILDETVRLSVEGSQILGPSAQHRVLELDEDEWFGWLERHDVASERFAEMDEGFYLVRNARGDFFGSGLLKDSTLKSWIPKGRAVSAAH